MKAVVIHAARDLRIEERESETPPLRRRRIQVADRDDDMVGTQNMLQRHRMSFLANATTVFCCGAHLARKG